MDHIAGGTERDHDESNRGGTHLSLCPHLPLPHHHPKRSQTQISIRFSIWSCDLSPGEDTPTSSGEIKTIKKEF